MIDSGNRHHRAGSRCTLHNPVACKRREAGLHYLTGATTDFTLYT